MFAFEGQTPYAIMKDEFKVVYEHSDRVVAGKRGCTSFGADESLE